MDEALGIGPVNGEHHDADTPALTARLVERAHELTHPMRMSLPEQAETLIAAGPGAVLGQGTWGPQAGARGDHRRRAMMDRIDDLARIDALETG